MCLRRLLLETLTALVLVLMPCAGRAAFDVQLQTGSEQVLGPPYTAAVSTVGPDELVDGETLTLDDGVFGPVVFAFDTLGNGVPPGSVPVYLASASDAADVRDALVDAINGAAYTDCDDFGCSRNPLVTVCPEPAANVLMMAAMLVLGALTRRSRSLPSPVEVVRVQ